MSGADIVVVDDDPDFLEYVQVILESVGYEVYTATGSDDGIDLIRSVVPDLIISDLMMSYSLEGVELAERVTHDPYLAGIPLVVVTSIANSPEAAGIDADTEQAIMGFLTKPVSPDELLAVVESCL